MEVNVRKLKALRRENVLTIGELAEKAEVGRNTISRMENGKESRPETIRKVAAVLGVAPKELVSVDEPPLFETG